MERYVHLKLVTLSIQTTHQAQILKMVRRNEITRALIALVIFSGN